MYVNACMLSEGSWDVKNCGRIAGLRFGFDGKLYVADAANGIFKVDVDAGKLCSPKCPALLSQICI